LRGKSRLILWVSICVAAASLCSCQEQINYPSPKLTSMTPTSTQAGQPAFTLMVTGGNFTPASTIDWNGSQLVSSGISSTLFVSTSEMTATVPASLIQNAGTAFVTVSTPSPGGGSTPNQLLFTITAPPSPVPMITALSPSAVPAGSASFNLSITGTNFVSQSTVMVNGNGRPTTFINATSLEAAVSSSDVTTGGTVQISVLNPQPQGGNSDSFPLSVTNPVPIILSISPTAAGAGSASTVLAFTGSGFVPNSTVLINGAAHTLVFAGATSIETTLTPADLANGGVSQVQVVNPAPGGGPSNIELFYVNPSDTAGLPVLVDVALSGAQANNGVCGSAAQCATGPPTLTTAGPSVSDTGEFVVFASNSTNLLSTTTQQNLTNGLSNIWFRDTCLVANATTGTTTSTSTSCTPNTILVSTTPGGGFANGPSTEPTIDSGGVTVAYASTATNLVTYVAFTGGTRQIYWQTPCTTTSACSTTTTTGTTTTTSNTPVLVTLSADGTSPGNGDSYNPVISADGQYVAFVSTATNLVSDPLLDGVTPQVYVRAMCAGALPSTQSPTCVPTTYLVSTVDGVTPANGASSDPSIADDGLYVAFVSNSTNLGSTSGNAEVFERSTCVTTIGTATNACTPFTTLLSTPDGSTPANGASTEPAISPDGRFIAFASTATNLVAGVGPTQEIYVYDTCLDVTVVVPPTCSPTATLVSSPDVAIPAATPANALSENPSISECGATTITITTTNCPVGLLIAFSTKATNLVPNVQNGVENVFVRSTCQDVSVTTTTTTEPACIPRIALASQASGTSAPASNGDSIFPSISSDGHTVAFISSATNLVLNDSNGYADVFLGETSF
jgi:hypothetical protein